MHQYGTTAGGSTTTITRFPTTPRPLRSTTAQESEPLYEMATRLIFANETVRLIAEHKNSHMAESPSSTAFNAIHGPLEEIPRYTGNDKRYAPSNVRRCRRPHRWSSRPIWIQGRYTGVFANDNGGLRDEMNAPTGVTRTPITKAGFACHAFSMARKTGSRWYQ